MDTPAIASRAAATRVERYREAERALWTRYGLAPTERFIDVAAPSTRLRVLDVGFGEPVLFVHGLIGPDAWAPLVRELRAFRCLVLDRPGWGLSTPVDYTGSSYASIVANVVGGVLDGLGLDRVNVVGASGGTLWAIRLAQRLSERVGRIALIGAGPVLADMPVPGWLRMLASPLGAILVRAPNTEDAVRSMLRQAGHGPSLDDGRIVDELIAWRLSASSDTDAMRHERDMLRDGLVSWTTGRWRRGALLADAELRAIAHPTLYVHGALDPIAPVEITKRVVDLLPCGELDVVDGGHEPWLEDASGVAESLTRFLTRIGGQRGVWFHHIVD
ncbi:MAG TPA: alpha/beta hydrolase [Candidatus Limnocylindria bacterium]|nr:alpha/beta hydrolase [Candidatus Limnocylindria bacterium]